MPLLPSLFPAILFYEDAGVVLTNRVIWSLVAVTVSVDSASSLREILRGLEHAGRNSEVTCTIEVTDH